MEMVLEDMINHYHNKNNKEKYQFQTTLGKQEDEENAYYYGGGRNEKEDSVKKKEKEEKEKLYNQRYGNDGGDDWEPAMSLFLMNPRKTFVSNYQKESYGYIHTLYMHIYLYTQVCTIFL
jgi:hypothetical protein